MVRPSVDISKRALGRTDRPFTRKGWPEGTMEMTMSYPKFTTLKSFGLDSRDVIGGARCWKDDADWHYDGNSGGAPKSAHPIRDVCWRGSITPQWARRLYVLWCKGDAKKRCHLEYELKETADVTPPL